MDIDGFVPSLEQFRNLVDTRRYAFTKSQEEYPKVVFLGTGSCIPSKTRNTSAIVLQIELVFLVLCITLAQREKGCFSIETKVRFPKLGCEPVFDPLLDRSDH